MERPRACGHDPLRTPWGDWVPRLVSALLLALPLAPLLAGCAGTPPSSLQVLSDAPDPARPRAAAEPGPASYQEALARWTSPQDIGRWLGARFEYDHGRALALSETARQAGQRTPVHAPEAFFDDPTGVCVDLTHFAVSTLRRIAPQARAQYLMIEFEPLQIGGHTLRRHWIAGYGHAGALWFFADSKRPAHVAGPYTTVEQFVREYAEYRQRPIVRWRLADSHERQLRQRAPRAQRDERG